MKDITQLSKDLKRFEKRLYKELEEAQYRVSQQVVADTINYAPGSGGYASSIKATKPKIEGNNMQVKVISDAMTPVAKSTGNSYNLGFLLENGTKPHLILPVDASVLHFEINGEDIFARIVHHPGFKARPHFTPALNKNKRLYQEEIAKAIERAFYG